MNKFIVGLFVFFISFYSTAQDIEFAFPDVILSGIETEVEIVKSSTEIPDILYSNGTEIKVSKNDNTVRIDYTFKSGQSFVIDNYTTNHPEASIIPLWMSILPPLLAIIFALVFKEVIFSFFAGLFFGGAIKSWVAEGFKRFKPPFYKFLNNAYVPSCDQLWVEDKLTHQNLLPIF